MQKSLIRQIFWCIICVFTGISCTSGRKISGSKDPLTTILKGVKNTDIGEKVLQNKDFYEVQIIYTQIDRDANGVPSFRSFAFNADSTRYFYPASVVKMPLAFLTLERINQLKRSGYPRLQKETTYMLDSLKAWQQPYSKDVTSPTGRPNMAHDIRQIFVVSDNLAYNHMFEFLGRDYINTTLEQKGYTRTGIMHRFNYPGRDNRFSSPIAFYDPTVGIFKQGELEDKKTRTNPQHSTLKGKGYYNSADSLVNTPFEMGKKNWFSLHDMEKMLRAVMFPKETPAQHTFYLTDADYAFLWHYMGIFPRECDYPTYDSTHYDGYVKFLMFGDSKQQQSGKIRSFNKVGEAYGTLTDVAYIVDFEHQTEFLLSATILCNSDGIFNDNAYDYDALGFPFLGELGRQVHAYDVQRKRAYKPDLSKYLKAVNGDK